jgi:hypothetical protein
MKRTLEALGGFEIAKQRSVLLHEERIVVPAGTTQSIEHLWPHLLVMLLVLLDPIRSYFE